ncbi:S41 family peptidase [uncultured Kordia sp.]|uniref:S41 family peptidase n=1 Tax=uncultured Kordia sp. TaxID=507699 RepID=UPI0026186C0E|nr:S41 family peptidase [uncultured Kordia sp.]
MKYFLLFPLISLSFLSCKNNINSVKESSANSIILDSIISITKENSLYTNTVDWNNFREEIFAKYQDNDSISSLQKPIEYMFTKLGDFHGFAMVNGIQCKGVIKRKRKVSYDYENEDYVTNMSEIYQKTITTTEIVSTILYDSIAYIQIPMIINNFGNDSLNIAYTIKIRNKICELNKHNPKGYIIDLRANIGGTMWPMFSGLGVLFPNMELGGDTKDGKTLYSKWSLINGNLHVDDYATQNMPNIDCNIQIEDKKIAILIGRYTSSSGEAVASGLKGQRNCKLFGEITFGASTTNSWFAITQNISVNPAIAYYMSTDYTAHTDGITPDIEIIEGFNFGKLTKGKVIDEAAKWIYLSK